MSATLLLDSNLIIYAAQPAHEPLRRFIEEQAPLVSEVSRIETLGYHRLTSDERVFLETFFEAAGALPISRDVIDEAIRLRQQRPISLGDALLAGTALSHGLGLATHNVSDFEWIEALSIVDPIGPYT